jgi:hypothetical protein
MQLVAIGGIGARPQMKESHQFPGQLRRYAEVLISAVDQARRARLDVADEGSIWGNAKNLSGRRGCPLGNSSPCWCTARPWLYPERLIRNKGRCHMLEPLRIHFEGKFIGEVPQTGDQETDLKARSKLLNDRGYLSLNRDQAIFRQAHAFAENAVHLFNTGLIGVPPPRPMNAIPFAVNAALAAELYLKTLGRLYGLPNMRGHDLLRLFDKLPAEAKERLRREIESSPKTEGIKDLTGFRTEVGRVRHVCEKWRYLHESDRAPEIRFHELIHVLNILHNTCRTEARLKPPAASWAPTGSR